MVKSYRKVPPPKVPVLNKGDLIESWLKYMGSRPIYQGVFRVVSVDYKGNVDVTIVDPKGDLVKRPVGSGVYMICRGTRPNSGRDFYRIIRIKRKRK